MRTVGSFVLWLVAMTAIALSLPLAWVATTIADEDGYVSFTAPFATDAELQDALTDTIADQLVDSSGVVVGEDALRRLVAAALGRLADDPDYPAAWRESQRSSHRATFEDREERRIVVDLAPFVQLVADDLADLPSFAAPPEELLVPVTREVDSEVIDAVRASPSRAVAGLVVAVVATAGSLLLARRRGTALGFWGLGVAVVGIAYMLVTNEGGSDLLRGDAAGSEVARTMQELLLARAVSSFDDWTLGAVVVGGVAAVLGFGARVLRR